MKMTVTQTSQSIPEILGATKFKQLVGERDGVEYELTIQNLTAVNIYIENGSEATVTDGYKLFAGGSSVEIKTTNINKLYLIAEGADATDVRIITT